MDDRLEQQKSEHIRQLGESAPLRQVSRDWIGDASRLKYSYDITWLDKAVGHRLAVTVAQVVVSSA